MKKILLYIFLGLLALVIVLVGVFYYQNLRGAWSAFFPSKEKIMNTGFLNTQDGFVVSVFAKNLPGARVMLFDKDGNMWLSQTGQGIISKLTIKNGVLEKQETVLDGLKNPHGLAFDPQNPNILYIAEETKIFKTTISKDGAGDLEQIIDLPGGDGHNTRTIGFGPDDRLYVSIGSSCNVCNEADERRASIWSLNKDGSDFREVAKGLRNSVFFVFKNGKIWATEMGRDLLGDDTPPDEINVIDISVKEILNFGWPICYGKNIHDSEFDKNIYIRNPCMEPFELPSHIDIPAHSAPLGLTFVPASANWPEEYKNDLIVAYHGSWNRSVPTGYKIVRLHLDNNSNFLKASDFIWGWLKNGSATGRPVDVVFDKNGRMYISDDRAGVIYAVQYNK